MDVPDFFSSYYRPGLRARATAPTDPHAGEVGTVESTRNVAGDMIHVVRFPDGTRGEYLGDDLKPNTTPTERI